MNGAEGEKMGRSEVRDQRSEVIDQGSRVGDRVWITGPVVKLQFLDFLNT